MTFFITWCQWYHQWHQLHSLGQNDRNGDLFGHVISLALASYDSNGVINGNIAFLRQNIHIKLQHNLLVMWFHWHHMSTMVYDTCISTGTTTYTKSHIIPLNNQQNMRNAMVSLMATYASGDRPCMCQKQNAHQMPHICHTCQLFHVHIWHNYGSIYTAINSVTMNTGIHTFHITDIYLWTNMSTTLLKYVPLHFYHSLHIHPQLLHISIKNQQTSTFIYHTIIKYVVGTNIPLKGNKYSIPPNYLTCTYGQSILIYMAHTKLLPLLM